MQTVNLVFIEEW